MGTEQVVAIAAHPRMAEQASEIRDALAGLGFDSEVREMPTRRGPELWWDLLLMVPLHGALTAIGTESVKMAFQSLRDCLKRGRDKDGDSGRAEVRDEAVATSIVFDDTAPDEALDRLAQMISQGELTRGGAYTYDPEGKEWRADDAGSR